MAGVKVKVTGAEQLTRISKVLTDQGNSKVLKRRMTKAFKSAAKPITEDQRGDLARDLPHRGGAAKTISDDMRTTVRTNYDRATVDLVDSWPGHDISAIERGILRHPTFERRISLFSPTPLHAGNILGRRIGEWHVTKVEPRILGTSFDEHKPQVIAELAKEMDRLAEEIARET